MSLSHSETLLEIIFWKSFWYCIMLFWMYSRDSKWKARQRQIRHIQQLFQHWHMAFSKHIHTRTFTQVQSGKAHCLYAKYTCPEKDLVPLNVLPFTFLYLKTDTDFEGTNSWKINPLISKSWSAWAWHLFLTFTLFSILEATFFHQRLQHFVSGLSDKLDSHHLPHIFQKARFFNLAENLE
jgi:hypothetical protein